MQKDVEATIRKVAQLPDGDEKVFLLQALEQYPDETVEVLGDLLEENDPAPIGVALQVLQTVGYPRDDLALSYLLWLVAYGVEPVSVEALHMLVEMGPPILPQLIHMAEEDKDWDQWLEDALYAASCIFHSDIGRRDEHELRLQKLIGTLVAFPEDVLPVLIYVLKKNIKDWTEVSPVILDALGYPQNQAAIPIVIWYASTTQNAGTIAAFTFLKKLSPEALTPEFIQVLWDGEKEYGNWGIDIWETCRALLAFPLSLVQCGSTLVYLLSPMTSGGDNQERAKKYLLELLKQIGPQCAVYALPTLIALLQREGTNEPGQQTQRLIASFDQEMMAPYRRLLATIGVHDEQEQNQ